MNAGVIHSGWTWGALAMAWPGAALALLAGAAGLAVAIWQTMRNRKLRAENRRSKALARQCNFLQDLLDYMPDAVFHKDAELKYRGCNRAFAEFIGKAPEEIIGRGVYELWAEDLAARYDQADKALFADGTEQRYQAKAEHPDGTRPDVEFNKAVYRDEQGRKAGIVGVMRDITAQCQLQANLHLASQAWQETFDALPDLIAIIDGNYRLVRVNRAMAQVVGTDSEELVGLRCCEVMHATAMPPAFCPLAKLIEDGKPHDVEFHSDIHDKDLWVSVYPIPTRPGQDRHFVHIVRDVTNQRQAQQKLEHTVAQLEKFNRLATGRELRMIELKREVNGLCEQLNQPPAYELDFATAERG